MGVLEDLAYSNEVLANRINLLEKEPSGSDLHARHEVLVKAQQQLEDEHQALSRRMHAIESESNQAQHGEIQALARRVLVIEDLAVSVAGLGHRLDSLRDTLATIIGQQTVTHQEAMNALRAEIESHGSDLGNRLATIEVWYTRQQAWNMQPWHVRFWRRLKGERP